MRHTLLTIQTSPLPLPAQVDVAIIGGGAAGIATAWSLARQGVSVAVFEKGAVAAEQSSRNWGWCRTLGRDLRELPLAMLSVDLWRKLQDDTGVDAGFRQTGVSFVTDNPRELAVWERWLEVAHARGLPARMLSAQEANASHAWQRQPWLGGIRTETDGFAEPSRAIPLLARHLLDQGVRIYQQCAVNELLTEGGRVAGVRTESGDVRAGQVVVAGGAWSSLLCRRHGLALPILKVHSSASATQAYDAGGSAPVRAPSFALRPCDDGSLLLAKSGSGTLHVEPDLLRYAFKFTRLYRERKAKVAVRFGRRFFERAWMEWRYLHGGHAPFSANRVLDPAPDIALVHEALREAGRVLPDLGPAQLARAWGGVIDNTPDGVPVISGVARLPGLFLCTGFSGHGFSSSLGAGRCLAQWMLEGRCDVDLSPFAYERLVDGRPLQPSLLY